MHLTKTLLLLIPFLVSTIDAATIPSNLEPIYAEAVIAFNQRNFPKALEAIESVLKSTPNEIGFLELKALTLKDSGDFRNAGFLYKKLLNLGREQKKSKASLASYHFELGTTHYHEKNYLQSRNHLQAALNESFNRSAAHFFIGTSYFEEQNWEKARVHLQAVLKGDVASLKPTTQIYLAQLSGQLNDGAGSLRYYAAARELAYTQLDSPNTLEDNRRLARHVIKTVDSQLQGYDRATFSANVGILSGYDSNVLSTPIESVDAGAKPASLKETLVYSLSYATRPLSPWQLATSYRGNVNYNFNQETKSGQFFSHTVGMYLTKAPLERSNFGFKIEGVGTLQFQDTDGNNSGKFGAYSLSGNFGPYAKIEIFPKWVLGTDTTFIPTKNYLDDSMTESLRKSGWEQTLRVYLIREESQVYWNPGVFINGSYAHTNGTEYRAKKIGADIANTMYLNDKTVVSTVLSYSHIAFSDRPNGVRLDDSVTVGVNGLYRLTQPISVTADFQYGKYLTNVAIYRYNRFQSTLGFNYAF